MRTFNLIKPYLFERRWFIAIGLMCLVSVDFLQLMIPRFIKNAIDAITFHTTAPTVLLFFGVKILSAGISIAFFRYGWRRCLIGTSRRVEEGLRNRIFSHLQILSPAYFDRVRTGDLMAHATNDLMNIRMAIGMGVVALTDSVVLGISAICFMAYINIRLTLFAMIPAPLIVFGARFFSHRMHRLYKKVQEDFSGLTEAVRERFAGIRLIKAHLQEEEEAEKLSAFSQRYITSNMSLARIIGAFFPMMLFFTNLSNAVVLYLGGRQAIATDITPGDFVAFISYLGLLTWPMMALGWVSNLVQRGKASLDRLQVIFDTRPEVYSSPDALPLRHVSGKIEFQRVAFTYGSGKDSLSPSLSDLDLSIPAGGTLGIVGPPGSGKSTLIRLIPRLYDVSSGNILLDGIDIRSIKLGDLRSHIAFVPQEPFLFAGTIRDNILFGARDVTEEKLRAISMDASLHEDVSGFPMGYDTPVGERGVILSGGQKQRVALARALLKDASIMLLDDPISQVDTRTGQKIIQALRARAGLKTIVIASHRMDALSHADQIIALKNGRILESGSHDQLLARGGYYADIYRMQELGEALDG